MSIFFLPYFLNFFFKFWNVCGDELPNDFIVNSKILVYDSVPETPYLEPVYILEIIFQLLTLVICRFANNFKIPDYSIACPVIVVKILLRKSICVPENF